MTMFEEDLVGVDKKLMLHEGDINVIIVVLPNNPMHFNFLKELIKLLNFLKRPSLAIHRGRD
jgi:hypothetical protein